MNGVVDESNNLTKALGLRPDKDGLFFGRVRGFPVGLKCIDPAGSGLLLFQIRHPLPADAPELATIQYSANIERLIAGKKLEISIEDRIAWLTFVEGGQHLADGSLIPLLNDVLSAFETAGLASNSHLCHYCRRNPVETVTCHDGKVAQICDACLRERLEAPANRSVDATAGAGPILILGPAAAVIGAVCWTLVWIGYDLLFEMLNTDVLHVPRLIEIIALLCVGAIVGGPVGLVIRRVPRRARNLSVIIAAICSVAAVLFGEVMYVAWLIYREFKIISVSGAWQVLPRLELETGGFHLAIKLLAAGVSTAIAVALAKPPKPRLNL